MCKFEMLYFSLKYKILKRLEAEGAADKGGNAE